MPTTCLPHAGTDSSLFSSHFQGQPFSASWSSGQTPVELDQTVVYPEPASAVPVKDFSVTLYRGGKFMVPAGVLGVDDGVDMSGGSSAYLARSTKYDATAEAPSTGGTIASFAGTFAFQNTDRPHFFVPKGACRGIVADVSNLVALADAKYAASKTTIDESSFPSNLAAADADAAIVADETTGPYLLSVFPVIKVTNDSDYPVYLTVADGTSASVCKYFEGVSKHIGVRSRESLTLKYSPIQKMWLVLERASAHQ